MLDAKKPPGRPPTFSDEIAWKLVASIVAGSRPYVFQIWNAKTRPIPPHGRVRLRVNWMYRGHFVYRTIYRGKPTGLHGSVSVF